MFIGYVETHAVSVIFSVVSCLRFQRICIWGKAFYVQVVKSMSSSKGNRIEKLMKLFLIGSRKMIKQHAGEIIDTFIYLLLVLLGSFIVN